MPLERLGGDHGKRTRQTDGGGGDTGDDDAGTAQRGVARPASRPRAGTSSRAESWETIPVSVDGRRKYCVGVLD